MNELLITVACPGEREVKYRFNEYPVRIGRSPECHLSICHEAVPRELCSAWLEWGGRTVRVEERPNLTNPLLAGKNPLNGGVSAEKVELTVGPVVLRLAPRNIFIDKSDLGGKTGLKTGLAVAAALALVFAAVLFFISKKHAGIAAEIDLLPGEPFCRDMEEHCDSPESCLERARLLSTRAKELLNGVGQDPSKKVTAAVMLEKAHELYGRFGVAEASGVGREADKVKEDVLKKYRQDVVALRRAVEQNEASQLLKNARRVRAYLADCSPKERSWLDNLVDNIDKGRK